MFRISFTFFFTFIGIISGKTGTGIFTCSQLNAQERPSFELSSYDTLICPNDTIYLDAFISGQLPIQVTYEAVIDGETIIKTASSLSKPLKLEITKAGIYTITSYANNIEWVDTNITFQVNETALPTARLTGGGSFCANDEIMPVVAEFTGIGPWVLTWQSNFDNAIIQEFNGPDNVLLNEVGTVNIRKIEDRYCVAEIYDTARIKLAESPVVEIAGAKELCENDESVYSTPYRNNYKYKWIVPNEATPRIGEDFKANTLPLAWNQAGVYKLQLIVEISNTGCNSGVINYLVNVYDQPTVLKDFDTVLCLERESKLTINPVSDEDNAIFWPQFDDTVQEVEIYEPGIYTYIESIPFGCTDTGSFRLIDKCIPEIYVAEAFSPNNDGINDLLEIKGIYYNLFFKVYTVNGELVYIKAPNMQAWDGTMNGKKMPNGSYYWKADFTDKFGDKYSDEGWVTLIR